MAQRPISLPAPKSFLVFVFVLSFLLRDSSAYVPPKRPKAGLLLRRSPMNPKDKQGGSKDIDQSSRTNLESQNSRPSTQLPVSDAPYNKLLFSQSSDGRKPVESNAMLDSIFQKNLQKSQSVSSIEQKLSSTSQGSPRKKDGEPALKVTLQRPSSKKDDSLPPRIKTRVQSSKSPSNDNRSYPATPSTPIGRLSGLSTPTDTGDKIPEQGTSKQGEPVKDARFLSQRFKLKKGPALRKGAPASNNPMESPFKSSQRMSLVDTRTETPFSGSPVSGPLKNLPPRRSGSFKSNARFQKSSSDNSFKGGLSRDPSLESYIKKNQKEAGQSPSKQDQSQQKGRLQLKGLGRSKSTSSADGLQRESKPKEVRKPAKKIDERKGSQEVHQQSLPTTSHRPVRQPHLQTQPEPHPQPQTQPQTQRPQGPQRGRQRQTVVGLWNRVTNKFQKKDPKKGK